ncbi:D-alanyl-D-alanine carboxypeptidase family protein [Romeria aff. gracilis LEGE 07310]|uniref:D-alanyl-D-alanine carboxypeptidase family protein n=1 Tax=Vasconcelosia minhoensis LEGE 07310 TaxID=915328 RepID=A0A8J7AJM3_9CYAN|nr:D-alanyl-D-alanine carboxypeptidase family protein [Romeria gracilis]MBE9078808.1 D-alanyl-D-alanine carboxypeptidase family protein [Romeria aff. gracilis LEGE 07310]
MNSHPRTALKMSERLAGRYEIVKQLGHLGATYLAIDHHSPSLARCVIRELRQTHPKLLKRFRREAMTLEQLGRHPQIPQLFAYFSQEERFYLAEEFIEGHALSHELVPGKCLSEGYVTRLLEAVLGVLAHVHRQNVAHGNITPESLIRRRSDGQIFLIGFGQVKMLSTLEVEPSGRIVSCQPASRYAASKQFRPQPSDDLYALGLIALEALAGMNCRDLEQLERKRYAGGASPQEDHAQISPTLTRFIDQLITDLPGQRYPSAEAALAALTGIVSRRQTAEDSRLPTVMVTPGQAQPLLAGPSASPAASLPDLFWLKAVAGILISLTFLGLGFHAWQWGEYRVSRLQQNWQSWRSRPQPYPETSPRQLTSLLEDGSIQLRPAAATAFWAMVAAARADGVNLYPLAGYQSRAEQREQLYDSPTPPTTEAKRRLRLSDYQTGYAIAIGDYDAAKTTDRHPSFAQTRAFRWLAQHGADYGFEPSFESATGTPIEPWHWRYVGDLDSQALFKPTSNPE